MMKKNVVRIDFCYDGTAYNGFQVQKDAPSVQAELHKALKEIYKEEIIVFVSGRTDTGVHAAHQVVSFKTEKKIPEEGLKRALNALLPKDIRIYKVSYQPPSFHARFSPLQRTYLYVVYNGEICPPFFSKNVWWVRQKIDLKKLKKTLKNFLGTHDFKSFSESHEKENHVRTVLKIKVKHKKNFIFVYITGNAFLRRMIRTIMGTSVSIASRANLKPEEVQEILSRKNRGQNPYPTAPPCGLYFYKIDFKGEKDKFVKLFRFLPFK